MKIRSYQTADESAVIDLWQRCGSFQGRVRPQRDIARKLTVQSDWFLVGEVGGLVMASVLVGYDGHRGWINYLAVHPEHQRRGHALALMNAAEERLLAAACPKINLQVRTSNTAVLDFYRHIGYLPDDVVSLGKRLIEDGPKT
jgi:ribosomal protein S18 acetylase RimI-like enzyme